jgi:hypothetical protein
MSTFETSPATIEAPEATTEPILETLLLVARRADALARRQPPAGRETDRRVWLRAELEIFDVPDL